MKQLTLRLMLDLMDDIFPHGSFFEEENNCWPTQMVCIVTTKDDQYQVITKIHMPKDRPGPIFQRVARFRVIWGGEEIEVTTSSDLIGCLSWIKSQIPDQSPGNPHRLRFHLPNTHKLCYKWGWSGIRVTDSGHLKSAWDPSCPFQFVRFLSCQYQRNIEIAFQRPRQPHAFVVTVGSYKILDHGRYIEQDAAETLKKLGDTVP